MKIERDYLASQELNTIEHQWWNDNAGLISRVWEMQTDVSWSIRKDYLKKAKCFFLKDKKEVTILELGCGSGWVGQFIAGYNLKIIGTDFSESQVELAKANARQKGLENYCDYFVANSVESASKNQLIDGVLIHAFMHHLDGKEIDDLLENIKRHFKKGTKIWIYEPAFHIKPSSDVQAGFMTKICLKISLSMQNFLHKMYEKFDLIDKETIGSFIELANQAEKMDWYLSPKEVPFEIEAFTRKIENYFELESKYWASVYIVGWAFETNLLKYKAPRFIINKFVMPFFSYTDKLVCKQNGFLRNRIICPSYAFYVWECILK